MENIFILLELSFDPIENNESFIEKVISQKENEWKRSLTNPVKKAEAQKNIDNLEFIRSVMFDSKKRIKEANEAKKIKKEKELDLEKTVKVKLIKGLDLTKQKEIEKLLKNFKKYGFTENDVKKIIKKIDDNSNNNGTIDLNKILSFDEGKKIQNALNDVGLKGQTLYHFLNSNINLSPDKLRNIAKNEKHKILSKGNKTPEDSAKQTLYGICETVFKDHESKLKYDNYSYITRYHFINDLIDDVGAHEKRITNEGKTIIFEEATLKGINYAEVDTYINTYCNYRGFVLAENKILCGLCNTENVSEATICSNCKKNLFLICPYCNNSNNNAAIECGKCRFNLSKIPEAIKNIEKAKIYFSKNDYSRSLEYVQKADILWPKNGEILEFKKTIESKISYEENANREIEELLHSKKIYTANKQLIKYQSEKIKLNNSLIMKVRSLINKFDQEIKLLENSDESSFFDKLPKLLMEVTDSVDISRLINKYPPQRVKNLKHILNKKNVLLSWGEGSKLENTNYILVRKEFSSPNSVEDGVILYTGTDTVYNDMNIEFNKEYYYSIFAERYNVYSVATRIEDPIVFVRDLQNISIISNDGKVEISWDNEELLCEVVVSTLESDTQPSNFLNSIQKTSFRKDGIIIDSLKNDTIYWFNISAGYSINNRTYYSQGNILSATPISPISAIKDLKITKNGVKYIANWTSNSWDFILLKSTVKPEYSVGLVYDYNNISRKFSKVNIENKSTEKCVFDIQEVGNIYIIPCSIKGNNAILGDFNIISAVPAPKNPSYDLDFNSKELFVNFDWNKKVNNSLLVFRTDKYPEGPYDSVASRVYSNKIQYQANEGMVISNPPEGIFYASIYHFIVDDNQDIYSKGLDIIISNEPQKEILYFFKYKKFGFFNKKSRLIITIKTPNKTMFPNFVIVSKVGGIPLRKNDGTIVYSSSDGIEINNEYSIVIDDISLAKDTNLKMFFVNDKNYKLYRLNCESSNKV